MNRFPTNSLVSTTLLVAMTLVGFVPASSAYGTTVCGANACDANGCGAREQEIESMQCCGVCRTGLEKPVLTCCSHPKQLMSCRCSVENERPATPVGNRVPVERETSRLAGCVAVAGYVCISEPQAGSTSDAALLSFLPSLCRQAVLCRWLT